MKAEDLKINEKRFLKPMPISILIIAIILPLGAGLWVHSTGTQNKLTETEKYVVRGVVIVESTQNKLTETEHRAVETLVVKILYSPELAAYIGSHGSGYSSGALRVLDIGDFIKIEWLIDVGEIRINIADEITRIFKPDELRGRTKLLNLTVKDLSINLTIGMLNIPEQILGVRKTLDVDKNITVLLENQPFIKWLEKEGFTYTVGRIFSIPSKLPSLDKISGVTVELELVVNNLMLLYQLYFDQPYVITADTGMPAELVEVSEYEYENFGIYFICLYRGGSSTYSSLPPKHLNITRPKAPFEPRRLTFNISSGTGEKVMKILRDNRLTNRLMESFQYKVEEIVRWMYTDGTMEPTAIVSLIFEEEGYELSVRIDMNAEHIKEIYFYPRRGS